MYRKTRAALFSASSKNPGFLFIWNHIRGLLKIKEKWNMFFLKTDLILGWEESPRPSRINKLEWFLFEISASVKSSSCILLIWLVSGWIVVHRYIHPPTHIYRSHSWFYLPISDTVYFTQTPPHCGQMSYVTIKCLDVVLMWTLEFMETFQWSSIAGLVLVALASVHVAGAPK